jgi:hypothetical protein
VLKDRDPFINSEFHIDPRNGTTPVRIGTRDFASWFRGAIDNINIYNRAFSPSEVVQLYNDTTPRYSRVHFCWSDLFLCRSLTYGTVSSSYLVSGLVRTAGGMDLIEEVQGAVGRALGEPGGAA